MDNMRQDLNAMLPPLDPFGFGTGNHKGTKYRKLQDYVRNIYDMDTSYKDSETIAIEGVELSVAKNKRLPLDKVRLAHYMEGLNCLLFNCSLITL